MESNLVSTKLITDTSAGEIVRLRRDEPPKQCILKVDSFSVLQASLGDIATPCDSYIESTEFSAGGYTWVMTVYPNGNGEEQGEGYLSLYVSMVDEANASADIVQAQLRFFVYDHIRDNYLCVQCVREKRFYAMKNTWVIPKFLSLATFSNASKGFLVNDCCVFGAEVLIADGCVHIPSVSIVDEACNNTFTFKIKNFSKHAQEIYLENLSFGGWIWALKLFPNGINDGKGNSLSLLLELTNNKNLICGSKVYADFTLSIKNQENGEDYMINRVSHWFSSKSNDWGIYQFLGLDELRNSKKCLLIEDTLVVEVLMEVMF